MTHYQKGKQYASSIILDAVHACAAWECRSIHAEKDILSNDTSVNGTRSLGSKSKEK
ncbi:hypothetical protein N9B79_00525 [bacterium]|nr:hypothetical protein [bacterium]